MKQRTIITPPVGLCVAQEIAYGSVGLHYTNLIRDRESQEYSACEFEMGGKHIKFRSAKITPTKIGQFVTFWKRIGSGSIMPYDVTDHFDVLIVSTRTADCFGQFVFPKEVLLQQGVISKNGVGGKRALRVYPVWDKTDSPQAKKTQAWQLLYFIEVQPVFDKAKMASLLDL